MSELGELAASVVVSDRTLRRGVECGLLRARRLGPRRLVFSASERDYVRRYWPLLGRLRRLLRTERNVRLAVLFGSVARGEDERGSDADLLVSLRDGDIMRLAGLTRRLERAVGREVQLIRLEEARRSPSLLADVLEQGRVLIDREGRWTELKASQARVLREAEREDIERSRRARAAVEYLRAHP